jgi:hypothetical protein
VCAPYHLARFLRLENVNGLAGPRKVQPSFVPIDMLLVPEQVNTRKPWRDCLGEGRGQAP